MLFLNFFWGSFHVSLSSSSTLLQNVFELAEPTQMFSPYNRPCERIREFPLKHGFLLWCCGRRMKLRVNKLKTSRPTVESKALLLSEPLRADHTDPAKRRSKQTYPPVLAYPIQTICVLGEPAHWMEKDGVQTWDSKEYQEIDGQRFLLVFIKYWHCVIVCLLLQVHFYVWILMFCYVYICCNYRIVHFILLERYTVIKISIVDVIISY